MPCRLQTQKSTAKKEIFFNILDLKHFTHRIDNDRHEKAGLGYILLLLHLSEKVGCAQTDVQPRLNNATHPNLKRNDRM